MKDFAPWRLFGRGQRIHITGYQRIRWLRGAVVIMASMLAAPFMARAAPTIKDFARRDIVTFAKISPDGQYIALSASVDGTPGLIVERLADHKVTAKVSAGPERGILDVWWASSERLVTTLYEEVGPLATPAATGEMIAFNADYSKLVYLFGFRGNQDKYGFRTKVLDRDAVMLNPLPDDPHHVLIAAQVNPGHPYSVIKLDVDDGGRQSLGEIPESGQAWIVTDHSGSARYLSITKSDGSAVSYLRENDDAKWTMYGSREPDAPAVYAQSFTSDNKSLVETVQQSTDNRRYCVMTEDIATKERKTLACDTDAELDHLIFAFDGSEPIAEVYQLDRPTIKSLNPDHADMLALQRVARSFPDAVVEPVSSTRDKTQVVVLVRSDRNPGDYYLFNTQTSKAEYLLSRREWMNPADMAPREPIKFMTRDGIELHGYLTRPAGVTGPVPLIVNPHGGPIAVADTWYWQDDAQLLATHGYAVLQINFRGSAGRGQKFQEAGKKAWATTMIDDLTDGAHWAIDQKITEAGCLCIYGGSYGGFAALMSAEREPDLYRCAVGYSGVYDLNLLAQDAPFKTPATRRYFEQYIGDANGSSKLVSPVGSVDRLKASLLIVHGLEDPRAPYSQAESLMAALDARRYPYEKLMRLKEAHGFYSVDHRVEFYTRLLKFLDHNLGSKK